MKILLIESDSAFAQELATAIEARGLEARITGDGKDAVELVRADRPDLVVLCVELPRMSGYTVCSKLKKDEQLKGIPLIIISAEATPETFEHHKNLKTHAEGYLAKPFSPADLLDLIGQIITLPPPPEEDVEPEELVAIEETTSEDLLDEGPSVTQDLTSGKPAPSTDEDLKLLDEAFENIADSHTPSAPAPRGKASRESTAESEIDRLGAEADAALAALSADELTDPDLTRATALFDDAIESTGARGHPAPAPKSRTGSALTSDLEPHRASHETGQATRAAQEELRLATERLQAAEARAKAEGERAEREERTRREAEARAKAEAERAAREEKARHEAEGAVAAATERAQTAEARAKSDAERAQTAERARAELQTKLAELEQKCSTKDAEINQADRRATSIAQDLEAAEGRAQEQEAALVSLRAELDSVRAGLSAAHAGSEGAQKDLEKLRARVSELEELSSKHEERVVKAYQKIKGDEKIREKTRKALTIALQLLEERSVVAPGSEVQPRRE